MTQFALTRKAEKLARLSQLEGFDEWEELVALKACDSAVPGICINRDCEYVAEVEPDARGAFCEVCSDNTVQSILILAELI